MTLLVVGLALFVAVHLVPTRPTLRGALIERVGALPYKGLFALASLGAFALIVIGKGDAPFIALWTPPAWGRHVTAVLMLPAFVLLAAAYLPGNIRRKTPHPMLLAVKIWALAHLLANGDLASVLIFASFGAYAVYDRISVKRRGLPATPQAPVHRAYDVLVVVVGVLAYAVVVHFHANLFGVPAVIRT